MKSAPSSPIFVGRSARSSMILPSRKSGANSSFGKGIESARSSTACLTTLDTIETISEISELHDQEEAAHVRFEALNKLKKNARKTPMGQKKWAFLNRNKDLLQHDLFRFDSAHVPEHKYLHYSEVPSLSELYDLINERNKLKRSILEKRQLQDTMDQQRIPGITGLVRKSMKCNSQKKMRDQDLIAAEAGAKRANKEVQQIVEITRTEPKDRSDAQCLLLRRWLFKHCRRDSIISTFLHDCDERDAITLCRGLQYQIFTRDEAIIRQGAFGYAYFIILNGECQIFVNKHLLPHEIANPMMLGRYGLGHAVDSIKEGADFGEYALIGDEKRSASVVCRSIVECLVCLQSHFKKCLQEHTGKTMRKLVDSMRKTHLFKGMSTRFLQQLFNRFKKMDIEKGQYLQRQEIEIDTVCLVISGRCKEFVAIKDKKQKTRKEWIGQFGAGDVVVGGYYAISRVIPISTIITDTACELLTISREHFVKSITSTMEDKLRDIGIRKHHYIKRKIKKFQIVIDDIARRFGKEKSSDLTRRELRKFEGQIARHGRWGRTEQRGLDNMIKLNRMESKPTTTLKNTKNIKSTKTKKAKKGKKKGLKRKSMKKLQKGLNSLNPIKAVPNEEKSDSVDTGDVVQIYRNESERALSGCHHDGSDEDYVDYRNREDLHQDLYHESRPMTASITQIAGKAPTNDFDGSSGTNKMNETSMRRQSAETAPAFHGRHGDLSHIKIGKKSRKKMINVPSIERIAIRIRTSPSKKQRFAANSALIGGLFDYEHTPFDLKEFTANTFHKRQRQKLQERAKTVGYGEGRKCGEGGGRRESVEGQPDNPYDFDIHSRDREEGDVPRAQTTEQLATRYVNDLMTSNFHSVSRDERSQRGVYNKMMDAIQSKHDIRSKKKRTKCFKVSPMTGHSVTAKMKRERVKKRKKILKRSSSTNKTMSTFPKLKCKTLRKSPSHSVSAFGSTFSGMTQQQMEMDRTSKMKKVRSPKRNRRTRRTRRGNRTRVKVTTNKYGGKEYELKHHGDNDIDLEISQWVDYGNVMDEFRKLQEHYDFHITDEVEECRTRLSRSGSSPDLLMKYYAKNHPKLLEKYVEHFKL